MPVCPPGEAPLKYPAATVMFFAGTIKLHVFNIICKKEQVKKTRLTFLRSFPTFFWGFTPFSSLSSSSSSLQKGGREKPLTQVKTNTTHMLEKQFSE